MVECVHHAEGCEYTCQRQHLAKHLMDSCPYGEAQRLREEEGESAIHKDVAEHNDDVSKVRVESLGILIALTSWPLDSIL
jgi:hypothetical protein